MKLRTVLLGLAALSIATAAAFFSVTGLSKLFAGASTAVILMASSLEFGKIVAASFLHSYWNRINWLLKTYLTIGVVVLILITSAGIYGFLTSAYQVTADALSVIDKQVEVLELKKQRFQDQLNTYTTEKVQLSSSITDLSRGLSNNVVQYTDSSGKIITTTSSATRVSLESQLNNAREQMDMVSRKIESISDSITAFDLKILEIQQNSEIAGEVGPLKYMAEVTGKPMNVIVNWFALLIIFVFDPMAISLVIAFNAAMKIDRGDVEKENVIKRRSLYGEVDGSASNTETTPVDDTFDVAPNSNNTVNDDSQIEANPQPAPSEVSVESNDAVVIANEESHVDDVTTVDTPTIEGTHLSVEDSNKLKKGYDELADLKIDLNRRGIDMDGNGYIDGYDTNGDGLIDEPAPSSSMRSKYVINELPYYARPNFNWGDRKQWINDQNAINYWLTHMKNKKDTTSVPDDFESKTY